jgi:uncharacterized protein (DUF362 family)
MDPKDAADLRKTNVRGAVSGMGRRSFLQAVAANSALLAAAREPSKPPYKVGVGYSSDPYTAASRAVSATGQFPTNLAGQTVVIKPNLVSSQPSTSGATTDPQVVKAIVDLAIAAGATQIMIIEAAMAGNPSNFGPCGYTTVFQSYSQVQLVDLRTMPYALTPTPGGTAFQSMWVPSVVVQPNTYYISAAKLKTHMNAVATLSMKNLVGTGYETAYGSPRQDLHYRDISQSIVDLNLTRLPNFGVIDGVWGMQGQGPVHGTPVATDVVLAGVNLVAVDRVGLNVMEFSQNAVPYLVYAAQAGLGPKDTSNVTLLGDTFVPYHFAQATTPPIVWQPMPVPNTISISAGQSTVITYKLRTACYTLAEIIQDNDTTPAVVPIRTLHGFTPVSLPGESVVWNGLNNAGSPVAPGIYLARIRAASTPGSQLISYAVGRITVTA